MKEGRFSFLHARCIRRTRARLGTCASTTSRVCRMVIRQLGADDADILWQARLQALRESPAAFLSTLAEAQNETAGVMRAQLADPGTRYFGAFIDGKLAGFLRYVRPMRMARQHTAEVHSVHVGTGHRGQVSPASFFLLRLHLRAPRALNRSPSRCWRTMLLRAGCMNRWVSAYSAGAAGSQARGQLHGYRLVLDHTALTVKRCRGHGHVSVAR